MAKKSQSFADKVARGGGHSLRKMAKLILSEKNENGHYSYRTKMVPVDTVKDELKAAKS